MQLSSLFYIHFEYLHIYTMCLSVCIQVTQFHLYTMGNGRLRYENFGISIAGGTILFLFVLFSFPSAHGEDGWLMAKQVDICS